MKSGVSLLYSREWKGCGDQGPARERETLASVYTRRNWMQGTAGITVGEASQSWWENPQTSNSPKPRPPSGEGRGPGPPVEVGTRRPFQRRPKPLERQPPAVPPLLYRETREGSGEAIRAEKSHKDVPWGKGVTEQKSAQKTQKSMLADFPTAGLVKALACSQTRDLQEKNVTLSASTLLLCRAFGRSVPRNAIRKKPIQPNIHIHRQRKTLRFG